VRDVVVGSRWDVQDQPGGAVNKQRRFEAGRVREYAILDAQSLPYRNLIYACYS
jgi:hypothetical protein